MDKKIKTIQRLVEDLKLPLDQDEVARKFGQMTEAELAEMISLYEEALALEKKEEELAREVNPKRFNETEELYRIKEQDAYDDYLKKMEAIQETLDNDLDKEDEVEAQHLEKIEDDAEKESDDIVHDHNTVLSQLKKNLTEDSESSSNQS